MIDPAELRRVICCEGSPCIAPEACYANDATRSYPVRIHKSADAVAKLLCARWNEKNAEEREKLVD